jgi:hypothetical protein
MIKSTALTPAVLRHIDSSTIESTVDMSVFVDFIFIIIAFLLMIMIPILYHPLEKDFRLTKIEHGPFTNSLSLSSLVEEEKKKQLWMDDVV